MHEDSCIGINYAHMFPKCFRSLHTSLGFALCFVSSILILVAVTIYSILTSARIPCRDSHCENGSFEVLSLHTPSVAADRRQLQTIQLQQNREQYKKTVKVVRLRFYPKTEHDGFPRSVISLYMHPHLSTFFEFL